MENFIICLSYFCLWQCFHDIAFILLQCLSKTTSHFDFYFSRLSPSLENMAICFNLFFISSIRYGNGSRKEVPVQNHAAYSLVFCPILDLTLFSVSHQLCIVDVYAGVNISHYSPFINGENFVILADLITLGKV